MISVDLNGTDLEELNITRVQSSIEVPPEAFGNDEIDPPYVFNHYREPVLFPLLAPDDVNASEYDTVTDSEVIGFIIPGEPVMNLSTPIKYKVQSLRGRKGMVNTTLWL